MELIKKSYALSLFLVLVLQIKNVYHIKHTWSRSLCPWLLLSLCVFFSHDCLLNLALSLSEFIDSYRVFTYSFNSASQFVNIDMVHISKGEGFYWNSLSAIKFQKAVETADASKYIEAKTWICRTLYLMCMFILWLSYKSLCGAFIWLLKTIWEDRISGPKE